MVPNTQGDEMRNIEAQSNLRRAQSSMMFLAVAKLNINFGLKSSLSSDYLLKVD